MKTIIDRYRNQYILLANIRSLKFLLTYILIIFSIFQTIGQCLTICDQRDTVTHFGFQAGDDGIGVRNTFLGHRCGYESKGNDNSFFGTFTGFQSDGDNNSFFGSNSGIANKGSLNSFFGKDSGKDNTMGFSNSFFGTSTGTKNTTGILNSFIGTGAGFVNTTGKANVFIGGVSGASNVTGSYNSILGTSGGLNVKGSGNVIIGYGAGPSSFSKDVNLKLYIGVDTTSGAGSDVPLIYGEFDNELVRVNGSFEAMGVGNNSDVNCKEFIVPIDHQEILDLIADLPVSEWSYVNQNIRHIGPMAQDFFETFGVGNNSTTISTIDADGVALAGIKALQKQNRDQQHEIDMLKNELADIKAIIKTLRDNGDKIEIIVTTNTDIVSSISRFRN